MTNITGAKNVMKYGVSVFTPNMILQKNDVTLLRIVFDKLRAFSVNYEIENTSDNIANGSKRQ